MGCGDATPIFHPEVEILAARTFKRPNLIAEVLADPAASIFEAIKEDPDRETLGRLLRAWISVFGKTEAMVRDAVKRALLSGIENQELGEILHDIAGGRDTLNNRKLGWWIKRHTDQIVDGLRFVKSSSEGSAERWRVESVSSVSSVLPNQDEKNTTTAEDYRRMKEGE